MNNEASKEDLAKAVYWNRIVGERNTKMASRKGWVKNVLWFATGWHLECLLSAVIAGSVGMGVFSGVCLLLAVVGLFWVRKQEAKRKEVAEGISQAAEKAFRDFHNKSLEERVATRSRLTDALNAAAVSTAVLGIALKDDSK